MTAGASDERAGEELAGGVARAGSSGGRPETVSALATVAASTVGTLERQPRLGQPAAQLGNDGERLGQPQRPAQERLLDPRRRAAACVPRRP